MLPAGMTILSLTIYMHRHSHTYMHARYLHIGFKLNFRAWDNVWLIPGQWSVRGPGSGKCTFESNVRIIIEWQIQVGVWIQIYIWFTFFYFNNTPSTRKHRMWMLLLGNTSDISCSRSASVLIKILICDTIGWCLKIKSNLRWQLRILDWDCTWNQSVSKEQRVQA